MSGPSAQAADGGRPTPGPDEQESRQRRARLAHIRQELLAPVGAIAGYAEILRDEAGRLGLEEAAPDLERILAAAGGLLGLIERRLNVDVEADRQLDVAAAASAQERLRHDLRNPLNVIKGYGEMLLEDAGAADAPLRPDLERLLAEAARLLANLDVIVDFSGGAEPAGEQRAGPVGDMVGDLLRMVRPREPEEAGPHETGRILVVDDNESNRGLLLRRLAREGHGALEADSGPRALQILEAEDVDLILLDLVMPGMNGLEVLERLKADERLREIPVIMVSGLRETEGVVRCIEAGAEDYLPKPFDPVLLRARIGASLERKRWQDRERRYRARLEAEKERSDALLRSILPGQIVARLNGGEAVIADRVEAATILFCDLVGFTDIASRMTPTRLVDDLNLIFLNFDSLARGVGAEKIKTIGDAYMAAAGLPEPRPDHAEVVAELALGMLETLDRLNGARETSYQVRIGIHTGSVVAGVIGTHRFIYDVWGDTVNVAHRLEACGLPGRIHVSDQLRRALEHRYEFEPRGVVEIRGRGPMGAAFLTGRKAAARRLSTPP